MKLITRDTDYAIRALCFIVRHQKRVVSVSELVKDLRIPRPFLRKILQILHKKQVLASFKGKGGGFRLSQQPHEIFIKDIMEVFQGPVKINECIFRKAKCPNVKKCVLRKKVKKIEQHVIYELKSVTIASLLSEDTTYGTK